MVLVTHRTSLLALVTRVIVIDGGKVVADGPRDRIMEGAASGRVATGGMNHSCNNASTPGRHPSRPPVRPIAPGVDAGLRQLRGRGRVMSRQSTQRARL